MSSRRPPRSAVGPPWWLVILIAVVLAVLAFFLWNRDRVHQSDPYDASVLPSAGAGYGAGADATTQGEGAADGVQPGASAAGAQSQADAARTAGAEPGSVEPPSLASRQAAPANNPRYPLPAQASRSDAAPLPGLADSDPPIAQELLGLMDRKDLVEYVNLQDLTRRFVVTVDHLPREMIPARYSALRRIPGGLAVSRKDGTITLKPESFDRYKPFVAFAEALGPKPMVAIYLHFYPLLQQEYRAMGFPKGYFNDRVIEAIDDMLAAPQVTDPIELVQPRILYRFADPALESLSAGRKIMIRIGPENAARLKKVLRGIRAELVRPPGQNPSISGAAPG